MAQVPSRYLQAATQQPAVGKAQATPHTGMYIFVLLYTKQLCEKHTTRSHTGHASQLGSTGPSTSPLHDASLQELANRTTGGTHDTAETSGTRPTLSKAHEQADHPQQQPSAAYALKAKLDAYRQQKLASKPITTNPIAPNPSSAYKPTSTHTPARPKATRVLVQQQHTPVYHAPTNPNPPSNAPSRQPAVHAPSTRAAAPSMPGVITTLAAAGTRRRRPTDRGCDAMAVQVVVLVNEEANHAARPCRVVLHVVAGSTHAGNTHANKGNAQHGGMGKAASVLQGSTRPKSVVANRTSMQQRAQRRMSTGGGVHGVHGGGIHGGAMNVSSEATMGSTQQGGSMGCKDSSTQGMHTPMSRAQRIPGVASTAAAQAKTAAAPSTAAKAATAGGQSYDPGLLRIQALQWRLCVALLQRRAAAQQTQAEETVAAAALAVADATDRVYELRTQVQCAAVVRQAEGLLEAQAPAMCGWLEQHVCWWLSGWFAVRWWKMVVGWWWQALAHHNHTAYNYIHMCVIIHQPNPHTQTHTGACCCCCTRHAPGTGNMLAVCATGQWCSYWAQ